MTPLRPTSLLVAWCIDMLAGDPRWAPHPVRAMGRAITAGEPLARPHAPSARAELAAGGLLAIGVVVGSAAAAALAIRTANRLHPALGRVVEIYVAWTTLATRGLLDEASGVLAALEGGDLEEARRRLSRIVGRDTEALGPDEVRRAVVETVAESASDGIVAPLFYLSAGGAPLAIA